MNVDLTTSLDRFVAAMQRAPGVVMREVDLAIQRVAIEGADQMKADAPKNSSELTNSIRNDQIGQAFHRVIADAPHAAFVHEGTGPGGSPPLDVLQAWIRTAQIQPRQARNVRDLAFLIQRKIRRAGIRAQPFSENTVTTTQERLQQLLPEAIDRGTREALA